MSKQATSYPCAKYYKGGGARGSVRGTVEYRGRVQEGLSEEVTVEWALKAECLPGRGLNTGIWNGDQKEREGF